MTGDQRAEPNRRALVVDDSDLVRSLVAGMLADGGYAVLEAATCEDAHRILATQQVDAMLCDFSLGSDVNGVECLRAAALRYPRLQCILMSGSISLADLPGLPFPMIAKPFDADEICALLARVLDRRSEGQGGGAG